MPFTFTRLDGLPDLVLVEPRVFEDERGWFMEAYKESAFAEHGITGFVQDNHSLSRDEGVLRGLHFQEPPAAQGKLVRCTRGRVWDVAVDIREGSPTFQAWASVELSVGNHRMLWVPEGFAHGFAVLDAPAELEYKVTAEYDPELDAALRWDDPAFDVAWPVDDPLLSGKDAAAPTLEEAGTPFTYEEGSA